MNQKKPEQFNWSNYLTRPNLITQGYLLNNQWVKNNNLNLTVTNPATLEVLGRLPSCGVTETHQAIKSSEIAFKSWSQNLAVERAGFLFKWAQLMKENQKDLATIMTLEQGKPLKEAKGEILYASSFLEWFAEEGKRTYGEVIPSHKKDGRIVVIKQPVGVVGIITPWNFPLAMLTRKIGPAIAAGCSCVVKPAEKTPYSAIALLQLAIEAGMEPGLINLVFGDYEKIGLELTSNPMVKKISFTGSTAVGKKLLAQSSSTIKRVSLELGGNAPFLVFDDANLEKAVDAAIICKFRNTGQTCVCANRFYVQEKIFSAFSDRLKERIEQFKVGNGLIEGVDQGPLIDQAAFEKVKNHLDDALTNEAEIITGGQEIKNNLKGKFFQPTLITNVQEKCQINHQETFGPLAPLIKFNQEEEAIHLANKTPYGLAGYFCTSDLNKAWRVAETLEVGMVGINEGIIATAAIPFGGVKESGLGREGSQHGINEYLNLKYILMGIES